MKAKIIEIGGLISAIESATASTGQTSDSHIEKNLYKGKWTDATQNPHREYPAVSTSSLTAVGEKDLALLKQHPEFLYLIKVWIKLTASVDWWQSPIVQHVVRTLLIANLPNEGNNEGEETRLVCLSYTMLCSMYATYIESGEDLESRDWKEFEIMLGNLPFFTELIAGEEEK